MANGTNRIRLIQKSQPETETPRIKLVSNGKPLTLPKTFTTAPVTSQVSSASVIRSSDGIPLVGSTDLLELSRLEKAAASEREANLGTIHALGAGGTKSNTAQDAYNAFIQQHTDYNQLLNVDDFRQYSLQGAGIKNPTWEETLSGRGLSKFLDLVSNKEKFAETVKNIGVSSDGINEFVNNLRSTEEPGNIVTFSRDNIDALYNQKETGDRSKAGGNILYSFMNGDEVAIYNYLLAKEGKETAQKYLDYIEEDLNKRQGQFIAGNVAKVEDKPVLHSVASGSMAVSAGIDNAVQGAKQFLDGNERLSTTPTQFAFQEIQQDQLDRGNYFGYFTNDILQTVSNMAPSILLSTVTGGLGAPAAVAQVVGATSMGISAAGNAYNYALGQGYGSDRSKLYGLLVGASEGALGYLLGGISPLGGKGAEKLLKKVASIDKAWLRVAAAFGIKGGSEAIEENFQNFLEPLFQSLLFNEKYDAPSVGEIAYTALVSFLTTGMLEGGEIMQYRTKEGAMHAAGIEEPVAEQGNNKANPAAETISASGNGNGRVTAEIAPAAAQEAKETVSREPVEVIRRANAQAAQQNEKTAAETQRDVSHSNTSIETLRNSIAESYENGTISAEEYDAAMESVYELESLDEASGDALDAYDPERLKRMEANDNGRSSVPDEGGEWAASQSAGEQAGQLAEGTGRDQSRQVQNQRAASRRDDVARYYESTGKQPVNAKEYLGSDSINKVSTLQEVPAEMIAADSELNSIAEDIRSMGLNPHIFVGDVRLTNGNTMDALIRDNDVFVCADSDAFTATQNWEHEKAHAIFRQSPGIESELYKKIVGKGEAARRKLHQTIKKYRDAYHGIYDVDQNGNEIWNDEVLDKIMQEILADAYAGKDTFAQGVEEYSDMSREAASQIEGRGGEVRGPPEGRFSMAGIKAETADLDSLSRAEEMERRGVSEDTIFSETGWIRGADKKWRFEVDDSAMKYSPYGGLDRKDTAEYARWRELEERIQNGKMITKEELEEKTRLYFYGHAERYANDPLRRNLNSFIDHPALFDAYPELRDANLIFTDTMPWNEKGKYNPLTNTIILNEDFRNESEDTILHEIQHIIQQIEGFSSGSSADYWERRKAEEHGSSTAVDLYYNTAGEIEARETAKRRTMTAEQRRESIPYRGDENTVFTNDAGVYLSSEEASEDKEILHLKEQIRENLVELNKMKPVADIKTPVKFPSRLSDRRAWIKGVLKTSEVDRQGIGVVKIDTEQIRKGLTYAKSPADIAAFAAVPSVIKRGRRIMGHKNHKGNNVKSETFAAPVVLNGKTGIMGVVVQYTKGNNYKAHKILMPDGSAFVLEHNKETEPGPVMAQSDVDWLDERTSSVSDDSISQRRKRVKGAEIFSAGKAAQENGVDPIEAMPTKARQVMERAEKKLQRSLSDVLNLPKKMPEGVLEGVSRELSREFLETGTVSDETIDRTFEQVYGAIESEVERQHGVDAEDYRQWAERDYIAEISKHLAEMRLVKRYAEEKAQQKEQSELDKAMTLSDLKKVYTDLKAARRGVDKAVARNLLTEQDNRRVNQLLRGDIDLDMLQPDVDNVRGITEVYNAKLEYEQFARQIRRWNAARKENLRALADKLLATASDWKDKGSGWLYSRETMERNIRDIVPDKKVAQEIIDTLFKPVHDGAAAANRMKNQYRDRVRKLELSRKMEAGNTISEAAAVQLLGEAEDNIRHLEQNRFLSERDGKSLEDWRGIVRDLWEQNPNLDAGKIRRAVKEFREIYDELFEQMNEARMRNGYEPVNYRKGYFPHFQSNDGDGILGKFGKSLGINTAAMQLPTTINGMTHNFKPGIQWFGSAQQRMGVNTSFDALEGFDSYIEGVADVIHQTDNIQRLRAFAAQVRYRTSEEGIRKQVDAIQNDNTIAPEDKQNRIEKLYAEGKFELGNLAVELDEYTNLLAGKKSRHDRDMEQKLGRRMYAIMKALESRVAANMVAINPGSWLTNFIPITQGAAALDTRSLLAGMWDTLKAYKQDDGFVAASSFLTNRRGSDPIVRTWSQAASAKLSTPMELIDSFTADVLVRSRYNENIRRGMSEEAALADADAFAADVMADRSKGATPTLFSQTNPLTKLLTQFQLEVNNQLSFAFKDMPREAKKKGKLAYALMLLKFALGAYIYNELYEWLIGRRPALDPINLLSETAGDLTGYKLDGFKVVETERTGVYDAGVNLAGSIAEEMPFIGSLLGGGRLPISSALPDVGNLWRAITDSDWDGKKRLATAAKELAKPATYLALPFGGGQVKKAVEGISAVAQGGSYSVDSKGDDLLQYPIYNSTPGEAGLNAVRAMLFGKSSLPEAREWVENDFDSLGAKQTALYDEMREGGASGRDVFEMIRNVEAADTNMDKIRAVAETSFDEPLKILAMANAMSESQFEKYRAATNAGVSTIDYVSLLQAIAANSASRGSKSANQEDVKSALNASNLTAEQKRAIWNSYSWKAESPW